MLTRCQKTIPLRMPTDTTELIIGLIINNAFLQLLFPINNFIHGRISNFENSFMNQLFLLTLLTLFAKSQPTSVGASNILKEELLPDQINLGVEITHMKIIRKTNRVGLLSPHRISRINHKSFFNSVIRTFVDSEFYITLICHDFHVWVFLYKNLGNNQLVASHFDD